MDLVLPLCCGDGELSRITAKGESDFFIHSLLHLELLQETPEEAHALLNGTYICDEFLIIWQRDHLFADEDFAHMCSVHGVCDVVRADDVLSRKETIVTPEGEPLPFPDDWIRTSDAVVGLGPTPEEVEQMSDPVIRCLSALACPELPSTRLMDILVQDGGIRMTSYLTDRLPRLWDGYAQARDQQPGGQETEGRS